MNTEQRQELWDRFLAEWPVNKIENMALEQYVSVGDKNTFTYWLETESRQLGSIKGGSSEKFGIYKRADSSKRNGRHYYRHDDTYTWHSKYGEDAEAAFACIKQRILDVIIAVKASELDAIEAIDIAPTLKWKVAFIYQNQDNLSVLDMYKEEVLRRAVQNSQATMAQAYTQLIADKPPGVSFFDYSADIWASNQAASEQEIEQRIESMNMDAIKNLSKTKLQELYELTEWAHDASLDIYPANSDKQFCIGRKGLGSDESGAVYKTVTVEKAKIKLDDANYSLENLAKCDQSKDEFSEQYSVDREGYWPVDYVQQNASPQHVKNHQEGSVMASASLNQILYGPPGTGKTYHTIEAAVKAAELTFTWTNRCELKAEYDRLVAEKRIRFVTFHQSYGYEEFVEGLSVRSVDGEAVYYERDGVFKGIVDDAIKHHRSQSTPSADDFDTCWSQLLKQLASDEDGIKISTKQTFFTLTAIDNGTIRFEKSKGTSIHSLSVKTLKAIFDGEREINGGLNPYYTALVQHLRSISAKLPETKIERKHFVLVIDEINRGNISKIFGELITLLEPSKRYGSDEALALTLPYSGETFKVPDNLYIIGTMNTADRSLATMDTALRRRFDFVEMMPNPRVLQGCIVKGINLESLLDTLNRRIEVLYDREHTLGHAFFIPVKDLIDEEKEQAAFDELVRVFQNKILPLLQEYFFDDWSKIRLVLADNQRDSNLQLIEQAALNNTDLAALFGKGHHLDPYGEGIEQYKLKAFDDEVWQEPNVYISMYIGEMKEQGTLESSTIDEQAQA